MRTRRRSAGLIAGLAIATSTTTACSLLTSLDGLSGGSDTGSDAGDGPRADGTVDRASEDAADPAPEAGRDALAIQDAGATDDAGPNLDPNGTFENGTCDPWIGFQGSVGIVTVAHTGTGACRACTFPSTTDYFTADDNRAPGPAVLGATYHAEAWVRTDPAAPAPPEVRLFLRNATVMGGTFVALESTNSAPVAINATWQHFETSLQITKNGTLNVFIGATNAPSACFVMDDVVLRRVN